MAGRKRIHRRSIDQPGAVHHLTFSCFRRQPFLSGKLAPRWFLDAVDRARARTPFELWAFVIMPEHVHLLLRPSDGTTIAAVLAQVKRPVTRKAQHWVQRYKREFFGRMADRQPSGKVTYRFWLRGGGYDRNLRSTDDVHEKIAYIHENPVRRGLVAHPADWLWSSWRAWHEAVDEPIRIDKENVPPARRG